MKNTIKKLREKYNVIFISGFRLDSPKTGGLRYNYEVMKCFLNKGFRVWSFHDENLPSLFLQGLWDSPFIIWHLMNSPNRYLIVQDSAPHKSYLLFNLYLRAFSNVKIVTILHHAVYHQKKSKIHQLIDKVIETLLLKLSHFIIVNSNYTKGEALELGIDERDIAVIYPAVDLPVRKFTRSEKLNDPPLLFMLGYVTRRKGLIYLIEALNLMKEKEFHLIVAGDTGMEPEYLNKCMSKIREYKLTDRIEFLGYKSREKINEIFRETDIFILPTLHEGFGMVIKEAGSFGIPIITTGVGAIPELVENEKSAILIPPKAPESLKDAIIRLLDDEELRVDIAKGAFNSVDFTYKWDVMRELAFDKIVEVIK